jgi:hypothetical protein
MLYSTSVIMSNFEALNPIDFGEPTAETRERLDQLFAVLKDLTPGVDYNGESLYIRGEIVKRLSPLIQPDAIVEYSYDQDNDPLFSESKSTYLSFRILEADHKTLTDLFKDIGDYDILDLSYRDENVEINYSKSLYDEMLHISEPLVAVIGSEDFDQNLRAIIDSVEGARETGVDRPTEGTMKQLIAVLEQEIAKRLTA